MVTYNSLILLYIKGVYQSKPNRYFLVRNEQQTITEDNFS